MPESGSQSWNYLKLREGVKKPSKRVQKLPKFEPNSSRKLRAPTGEPLAYSESPEAVRRRKWLNKDDTRRVIESRAKTLHQQREKKFINPNRERFGVAKKPRCKVIVGQTVTFVPPAHAKARSLWKGEVIALRGTKEIVIDRSPVLKTPRRQCNIEVIARGDYWVEG